MKLKIYFFNDANSVKYKKGEEMEVIARTIIIATKGMFTRHSKIADPGTRYALLVDKLLTIIDVGSGLLKSEMANAGVNENVITEFDESLEVLNTQLNQMMAWIVSPQYSPDHPYGNTIMNTAKTIFESNCNGC